MKVADYSFSTFTADQLTAAGFEGVIRYLSPPPNEKNWTAAQIAHFRDAGMWLGFVWEMTTTRPRDGYDAGVLDGRRANALMDDLGVPSAVAIYYANDERDTPASATEAYFRGVRDAGGRPRGAYGKKELVEALWAWGYITYGWMVETWWDSGPAPLRHPDVHLVQIANFHSLDGTDDNEVMKADWGGWAPPGLESKPERRMPISILTGES